MMASKKLSSTRDSFLWQVVNQFLISNERRRRGVTYMDGCMRERGEVVRDRRRRKRE